MFLSLAHSKNHTSVTGELSTHLHSVSGSTVLYYSIHTSVLEMLSFLYCFQSKTFMLLCPFPCVLHARSTYPSSFDHPNNILRTAQLAGLPLSDILQYAVTHLF